MDKYVCKPQDLDLQVGLATIHTYTRDAHETRELCWRDACA